MLPQFAAMAAYSASSPHFKTKISGLTNVKIFEAVNERENQS